MTPGDSRTDNAARSVARAGSRHTRASDGARCLPHRGARTSVAAVYADAAVKQAFKPIARLLDALKQFDAGIWGRG